MELSGENRRLERSGLHRRPLAALLHWVRLERCTPSAQAIWKRKNERFGTRAVTTLGFQRLTARRWLRVQQGPLQPKQQTNWHNRDTGFYYLILVFDSKRCSITAHFFGSSLVNKVSVTDTCSANQFCGCYFLCPSRTKGTFTVTNPKRSPTVLFWMSAWPDIMVAHCQFPPRTFVTRVRTY